MGWLQARLMAISQGGREAFFWVLALAFILRFGLGVLCPSLYYADEIYQVIEPAYHALTGQGLVTWEWQVGARSWLWPGMVAGAMWPALTIFGSGPPVHAAIVLICTLMSMIGVAAAFGIGRRYGGVQGLCAGLAYAVWYELVFFGVRTFNECIAANFVIAAIYFADRPQRRLDFIAAGAAIGFAFAIRYHLGPALAVIGVWALWRALNRIEALWCLALGAAAPILFAGLLDFVTWGAPFSSYIVNFQYNIVNKVADKFGVTPPTEYVRQLIALNGGLAPIMGGLALFGARKCPLPLVTALMVLAVHSAIGHKEYRFIVPMIACLTLAAGFGLGEAAVWVSGFVRETLRPAIALGAASLLVACSATAGLAHEMKTREWRNMRVVYQAFWSLREQPQLCGIGLMQLHPYSTPGDAQLPRGVPLYYEPNAHLQHQSAYNELIAFGTSYYDVFAMREVRSFPAVPEPFAQTACFNNPGQTACVYRRPGGCEPNLNASVNFGPWRLKPGE